MTAAAETLGRIRGDSLTRRAWRNLRRNRTVIFCFAVIALYVLTALLGYLGLLPDMQAGIGEKYEAPILTVAKLFGTDIFGPRS